MGQCIPEPRFDRFQNFEDRRVVASVLWRRDVMIGIVVVRRRDGWSALVEIPEGPQRRLARGVSRRNVIGSLTVLRMAVEWALRDLRFEDCLGFAADPRQNGEEPAYCGCLRGFGGDFVGVDIGEFELPNISRLN